MRICPCVYRHLTNANFFFLPPPLPKSDLVRGGYIYFFIFKIVDLVKNIITGYEWLGGWLVLEGVGGCLAVRGFLDEGNYAFLLFVACTAT